MKKWMLKTVLSIGTIMAFGFTIISQCKADPAPAQTTAEVQLTVNPWQVTISVAEASSGLNLGTTPISNTDQILSGQFATNTFQLRDFKWAESGYYTTLSVTNLSWEADPVNHVIYNSNIQIKAGWLTTIEWVTGADAWVNLGALSDDYVVANEARTYFHRDVTSTANAWRLWKYGDALWVKVTIPAHTIADNYHGTITYTLIER